jgi:hypothetical protein
MSYKATIVAKDPRLFDIITPDLKSDKRSSIKSKKKDGTSVFEVTAKDPVALRASLNTLAKSFIIFEKSRKLK